MSHEEASLGDMTKSAGCPQTVAGPQAVDCIFEKLYKGSIWGESTDASESAARSFTYGEVTALGVHTLLENVAHAGAPLGPDDSFADLGSGMGRAVLQVRLATPVSRSVGVELSEARHKSAEMALSRLQGLGLPADGKTHLILGDVRDSDAWSASTLVYMSSLCFPAELMHELSPTLATALSPGTLVISIIPLPGCHPGLMYVRKLPCQMTWHDQAEVFLYAVVPTLWQPEPRWLDRTSSAWSKRIEQELHAVNAAGRVESSLEDWVAVGLARWGGADAQMRRLITTAVRRSPIRDFEALSATEALKWGSPVSAASLDQMSSLLRHRFDGGHGEGVDCAYAELAGILESNLTGSQLDEMLSAVVDLESSDPKGETMLHKMAVSIGKNSTQAADILIQRGASVDARDSKGRTPLMRCSELGLEGNVFALLSARATVDASDAELLTPLQMVASRGHASLVTHFLDVGAAVDGNEKQDRTPLIKSLEAGHLGIAELLLKRRASPDIRSEQGRTPLHVVAKQGPVEAIRILQSFGADMNAQDQGGMTPVAQSARVDRIHLVKELLACRADVNAVDSQGRAPLIFSTQWNKLEIPKALLGARAEVHARDNIGRSALEHSLYWGHLEFTKLLLDHSAPDTSALGALPLVTAVQRDRGDLLALLIARRADAGAALDTSAGGQTALHAAAEARNSKLIEMLLETNPLVNVSDAAGITPLHIVVKRGGKDAVTVARMLLDAGASAMAVDASGKTPLHFSAEARSGELVQLILEGRAEADVATVKEGATPLLLASKHGDVGVARALLEARADPMRGDRNGRSPRKTASSRGHEGFVKILEDYGAVAPTTASPRERSKPRREEI